LNALGPIFSFLSSGTWAFGTANYSKLSRSHRPFDVNYTRALLSLPLFVLAAFITCGSFSGGFAAYQAMTWTSAGWLFASVVASYATGDSLFLWSTISLGVPGALAIASSYPILTALLGIIFGGQTVKLVQWIGLFLSVAGVIMVILNDPKGVPKDGHEVHAHPLLKKKKIGIALAGLTAIAWAVNGYSVSRGGQGLNTGVANTFRMATAIPAIATMSFLLTKTGIRPLPGGVVRKYSWAFIIEAFFGSYFFMYGLTHTSLVLGNTLSALAPVLSVPVSVALKLERFSWIRTLAVVTVVVGLSLLFR
jgi:drug/metabolite transporter (DMT)-like permease